MLEPRQRIVVIFVAFGILGASLSEKSEHLFYNMLLPSVPKRDTKCSSGQTIVLGFVGHSQFTNVAVLSMEEDHQQTQKDRPAKM